MRQTIDSNDLNQIVGLIDAIQQSVETIPGHSDPNSVNDCWRFLREDIESLVAEVKAYRSLGGSMKACRVEFIEPGQARRKNLAGNSLHEVVAQLPDGVFVKNLELTDQ